MDILAHTLWANAGARGANKLREKKGKPKLMSPAWTGFWGVFPDLFAFTIPFIFVIFRVITGEMSLASFGEHHVPVAGFDLAAYLYQWSNMWYMIINYSALLVIWGGILLVRFRKSKTFQT